MKDILKLIGLEITKTLNDILGNHTVNYNYNSIQFKKSIGNDNFILKLYIEDNNSYTYISLTNILIPSSMKRKGVSLKIINTLLTTICNKYDIDLYITDIVNDGWKNSLVKHGGIVDQDGDILLKPSNWIYDEKYQKIKFIPCGDELILFSEVNEYNNLKKKVFQNLIDLFKSWHAEIEYKNDNTEIMATLKNDITYFIKLKYNTILFINDLINNGKLDEYLKSHNVIGAL